MTSQSPQALRSRYRARFSVACKRAQNAVGTFLVAAGQPGLELSVHDVLRLWAIHLKRLGEYSPVSALTQETVWFNGQPVGAMIGGVLYIVRADHLGTPRSISRASDNLEVWRWDSDPFGDTYPTVPALNNQITYNLRFAGQQYDAFSGYYYNWMRDYDPNTGRYLQADPLGLGGGLSRYAYVGGNPLNRIDPLGLAFVPSAGTVLVGEIFATIHEGGVLAGGYGIALSGSFLGGIAAGTQINSWVEAKYGQNAGGALWDMLNRGPDMSVSPKLPILDLSLPPDPLMPIRPPPQVCKRP